MDLRDYAPDSLAFGTKMQLFGLGWYGGSVKGGRVLIFRLINALQKDIPVREGAWVLPNRAGNEPQREREMEVQGPSFRAVPIRSIHTRFHLAIVTRWSSASNLDSNPL
jgi:hypothetical protein